MSHKDNMDLRNKGAGGWFYAENELFSIFAPLIGPEGVVVYMAMCRLIPWAAVDPDVKVSIRTVMEASCVKRTQVADKMREVVAMGMLIETPHLVKNRPSTYKIPQLRDIAALGMTTLEDRLLAHIGRKEFVRRQSGRLGEAEMVRRFGVRWADKAEDEAEDQPASDETSTAAQVLPEAALLAHAPADLPQQQQASPAASSSNGVRPADTESSTGKTGARAQSVSATEASVSARKASVSATKGSVSAQSGRPLTRREDEEEKNTPPLSPVPGDGGAELVLSFADPRPAEACWPECAGLAARWVIAQCGLTRSRGLENVLVDQLTKRARQQQNESLAETASHAVAIYRDYCAAKSTLRFAWGPQKFFAENHWQQPKSWPRDRELEASKPSATVGVDVAPAVATAALDNWYAFVIRLRRRVPYELPVHQLDREKKLLLHEGFRTSCEITHREKVGDLLIVTVSSEKPDVTQAAFEQFHKQVDREARACFGCEVRFVVSPPST